jgi:hypothetical protein
MKAASDFVMGIWHHAEPLVVGVLAGILLTSGFFLGYGTKKLKNGRSRREPIKPASDSELLS